MCILASYRFAAEVALVQYPDPKPYDQTAISQGTRREEW